MNFTELGIYQRSDSFIWTDTYISKNMLSAHLNLHNDAASRNMKTVEKTVSWIAEHIPKNSRVLDLGCGPGLYSSLLAERGCLVTGVDISPLSISYAKDKAAENRLGIDYRCADYLRDDIGSGYDAIICIYCDFGALTPSEQSLFLKKVHNALSDDGVLIFDVFMDGLCESRTEKRVWEYCMGEGFWCSNPHFILHEDKHFAAQKAWGSRNIIIEVGRSPKEYITWDSYYNEDEIRKVLLANGFGIKSVQLGLVEENDFTSNDVMFIIASRELSNE